jgi:predicted PurR-regulated permease PerM
MSRVSDTPLDTSLEFRRRARYVVAFVALVCVALMVLWITRQAVLLVFLGLATGSLLYYASRWLADHAPGPRGLWLGVLVLFFLGLLVVGAYAGVPRLEEQARSLMETAPEVLGQLEDRLGLPENAFSVPEAFRQVAGQAFGIFSSVVGVLTGLIVILVVAVYTAAAPRTYVEGAVRLVDRENQPFVRELLYEISRVLLGWTRGVGIAVVALTAIAGVGLTIIGVPGALALAVFAGALTAIPTFGPLVGWAPAVAVGFSQGVTTGLWTLGLALVGQQLEGDFITPKVQGAMVKVAPAVIIAVQIVLGSLAGFLGLLLAVPVAGTGLVLIQRLYVGPMVEGEPADPENREVDRTPGDKDPAV